MKKNLTEEKTHICVSSIDRPVNSFVLQGEKTFQAKFAAVNWEARGDESGVSNQDVGAAKEREFQVFQFS